MTMWFSIMDWGHVALRQSSLAAMLILLGVAQLASSPLPLIWRRCLATFLFIAAAATLALVFR
jgi:hypothetical protein